LDKDGRVKTSHAWFVAYAPADNPEIAVVSFVYAGGEGSSVAAPVVNNILRYYFGFDRPDDTGDNPADDNGGAGTAYTRFSARVLGADTFPGNVSAVNGYVRDTSGAGIAGVTVEIIANGEVVAQVVTGSNGQFDYNALDPRLAAEWTVQMVDFAAKPITLMPSAATRYYVEFQAEQ